MRLLLLNFVGLLCIGSLAMAEHSGFKPSTDSRPVLPYEVDPKMKEFVSTSLEKILQRSRPEWRPILTELRRAISGLFLDREKEAKNQAVALLASLSHEELAALLEITKTQPGLQETVKMVSDAIAADELTSEALVSKLDSDDVSPAEEAEFLNRLEERGIKALSKAIGIRSGNLLKLSDDILKNDAESAYVASNVVAFQRANEDFTAREKAARALVQEKTNKLNEGIKFYQPWRNDPLVQKTLQGYRDQVAAAKQNLVSIGQERARQIAKSAEHLTALKTSLDGLDLSQLSKEGQTLAHRLRLATNTQLASLTGQSFDSANPEGKWASSQAFNEGTAQAASVKNLVDGYLSQMDSPLSTEEEKAEALRQLRRIYAGEGNTKGLDRFALALERAKASSAKTTNGKLDPKSLEYQDVVRWVSILSENGKMPFTLDSTNATADELAVLGLDPTTIGRINFADSPFFTTNMQNLVKHLPTEALTKIRLASPEAFRNALPPQKEMRSASRDLRTYNVTADKVALKADLVEMVLEPVAAALKDVSSDYEQTLRVALNQTNPQQRNEHLQAVFERMQVDFKSLVPMAPWTELKPLLRTALIAAATTPGKTDLVLDFLQKTQLNPKAKEHLANIGNAVSQLEDEAAKKFLASLQANEAASLAAATPAQPSGIRLNSAEIPSVATAAPVKVATPQTTTYKRPQRFWRGRFR